MGKTRLRRSFVLSLLRVQERVIPSSLLRARAIGLMRMIDQGEKDDKIIAVCDDDPEYRHYNDISELSPQRLPGMKRFFELYKNNDNREVAVDALLPTTTAREAIQNSMDLYAQYIFAKPEAVEGVQLFIVVLWVRRGFEGRSLRLCGSFTNSVLRMMALAAIPFFSQELCTPLS